MRLTDELNLSKLDGGVWWNYSTKSTCPGNVPHPTDGCFLVIPHVGSRFAVVKEEMLLPYEALIREGKMPEERMRSLIAECVAKTLLRGWANWDDADGNPMPWSEAKATEILSDRRFLTYAHFVESAALSTKAALAREEEQAKGN